MDNLKSVEVRVALVDFGCKVHTAMELTLLGHRVSQRSPNRYHGVQWSGAPFLAVAVARPWNPSTFRGTTEPSPTPKPEVRFI